MPKSVEERRQEQRRLAKVGLLGVLAMLPVVVYRSGGSMAAWLLVLSVVAPALVFGALFAGQRLFPDAEVWARLHKWELAHEEDPKAHPLPLWVKALLLLVIAAVALGAAKLSGA